MPTDTADSKAATPAKADDTLALQREFAKYLASPIGDIVRNAETMPPRGYLLERASAMKARLESAFLAGASAQQKLAKGTT